MKRKISQLVLGLLVVIASFVVSTKVAAEAVNYQALKYGTQQTSMASNYYVKPANVVANGDQYLVTMTIHTGTQLGAWPVTVLSINGQGPPTSVKLKVPAAMIMPMLFRRLISARSSAARSRSMCQMYIRLSTILALNSIPAIYRHLVARPTAVAPQPLAQRSAKVVQAVKVV